MPEEVHVWLHPKEGLADGAKAGDVQYPSRVEVLQLQAPLVEGPAQEPVRGIPESAFVEDEEGDNLISLGLQNNFPQRRSPPMRHLLRQEQPVLDEGSQHLFIHGGRPLVCHRTSDLWMIL